jgi:methanogenic corrinoid protein MtbC1
MANSSCVPDEASAALSATLVALLADHDADGAVAAAVAAVESGAVSVENLYCAVLIPLLSDVGGQWHSGRLHVWEEHLDAAAVRAIIEGVRPQVRAAHVATQAAHPDAPVRRALFACPPEEWHVLSLRMLADRFSMEGWETSYLGANVPVAEIVAAALALKVELVVLTAATHYERLQLRELIDGIKDQLPGIRLLAAGPAFARDQANWSADELVDPEAIPAAYA